MSAQPIDGPVYASGMATVRVPLTQRLQNLLQSYRTSTGAPGEPGATLTPVEAEALLVEYLEDQERRLELDMVADEYVARHGEPAADDDAEYDAWFEAADAVTGEGSTTWGGKIAS